MRLRRINWDAAGITSIDSSVAVIMPPIVGTAMPCIMLDPVLWLYMIGNTPARITLTVTSFGRTRNTASSLLT
jgi:hypothetical protein